MKKFAIKRQLVIIGVWARTKHHKSLVKILRIARTPRYVAESQKYTNETPGFCLDPHS